MKLYLLIPPSPFLFCKRTSHFLLFERNPLQDNSSVSFIWRKQICVLSQIEKSSVSFCSIKSYSPCNRCFSAISHTIIQIKTRDWAYSSPPARIRTNCKFCFILLNNHSICQRLRYKWRSSSRSYSTPRDVSKNTYPA